MDYNNRGKKHICKNCSTKFYDLNKEIIICPNCGAKIEDSKASVSSNEKVTQVTNKEEVEVDKILSGELDKDIGFEDDDDDDDDKDDNIINIE